MAVLPFTKKNKDAQVFHSKLNAMLAINRQGGWIEIMDFIYHELPFLMKPGRPKTEDIRGSFIADLGYSSWKSFVEDGLGWSYYTWKKWGDAYRLILESPFLRELRVSRNAIIQAHKTLNNQFPKDKATWSQYVQSKKQKSKILSNSTYSKNSDLMIVSHSQENYDLSHRTEKSELCSEIDNYREQVNYEQSKNLEYSAQNIQLQPENQVYKKDTINYEKACNEKEAEIYNLKSLLEMKDDDLLKLNEAKRENEDLIENYQNEFNGYEIGIKRYHYFFIFLTFLITALLVLPWLHIL